jgi:Archaea-specific editing domain of threonyl-tRNA synthetase
MKSLLLGCATARFTNVQSAYADGPEIDIGKVTEAHECLVVLLCVELTDLGNPARAAKALCRGIRKAGYSRVLINPFAHLSENLASPQESISFLSSMVPLVRESLVDTIIEVKEFGIRKKIFLDVLGGTNDQRFISA